MASQQKLLNADRLLTVLFSTHFEKGKVSSPFLMLFGLVSQRDQSIKKIFIYNKRNQFFSFFNLYKY